MNKLGILAAIMLLVLALVPAVIAVNKVCEPSDVVIVIDKSGSMTTVDNGETETRMSLAKDAAKYFVDLLAEDDKSGLVSFASTAHLDQELTDNGSLVKAAIDALVPSGLTCISCGIEKAQVELEDNGRENVTPVIVMLTDGYPTMDTDELALAAAGYSKGEGTTIFTIGIGEADQDLLEEIASDPTKFSFGAPSDLDAIYEDIAGALCQPDDEVPEFGTVAAGVALVGAIAGFFVLRRRRD